MKSVGESGELHFPLSRWRERAGVRVAPDGLSAFGCATLTRRSCDGQEPECLEGHGWPREAADLSRQRERRECVPLGVPGQRA
jgi:hypothetical protein